MLLHGVLLGPVSGSLLVLLLVGLVNVSDFRHKWVLWVWISQERADRQENLADSEGWAPLVLEDVQAYATMGVDVWMVDSGAEGDFWRLERVVDWEVDVQEEQTSRVWAVVWAGDGGLPVVVVAVVDWTS